MATYTVGQQLPSGATVVSDTVQTLADGTTVETMRDSAGNSQVIATPAAGSPVANQQTLQQKAQSALTANATFQAQAKPSTAAGQASAAYDQAVAQSKQLNGVIRLLLGALDSTTGT